MKKSVFTWMRQLSLLTASSLLLATEVQAQVTLVQSRGAGSYGLPTITATAGDACLTYNSSTGLANNHIYNFSGVAGLNTPTYTWSILGGASIVGSSTGSSVTVKPVIDSKGRYNKAKLTIFYRGTIDSTIMITPPVCNGTTPPAQPVIIKVPKSGTLSVDLYQNLIIRIRSLEMCV